MLFRFGAFSRHLRFHSQVVHEPDSKVQSTLILGEVHRIACNSSWTLLPLVLKPPLINPGHQFLQ